MKELEIEKEKKSYNGVGQPKEEIQHIEDSNHFIASKLFTLLSSTFDLMLKTQNYHWNVIDKQFKTIHELTEEQYTELFESVDIIAERIRMLDKYVNASLTNFTRYSEVGDTISSTTGKDIYNDLKNEHEKLRRIAIDVQEISAQYGDEATADLAVERIRYHEKQIWILKSSN